jgi:hypothetical protein
MPVTLVSVICQLALLLSGVGYSPRSKIEPSIMMMMQLTKTFSLFTSIRGINAPVKRARKITAAERGRVPKLGMMRTDATVNTNKRAVMAASCQCIRSMLSLRIIGRITYLAKRSEVNNRRAAKAP